MQWPLVAAFVAINSLVAVNAVVHDPLVGYDADGHVAYLQALAGGALPTPQQSDEFFNAPLPYVPPAVIGGVAKLAPYTMARFAQGLNVVYSVLLTYFLIRLARLIAPRDRSLALWTLILLGMTTVYFRTFAFVRGEAMCAMLAVVACERALALLRLPAIEPGHWAGLGGIAGLLILAKQWGVFVALALGMFWLLRAWARADAWRRMLTGAAAMTISALIVGGWFYAYLFVSYGSPAAFNRERPAFSLASRPLAFYTTLGLDHLFVDPVREVFSQPYYFVPLMYSDTWGDYWGYWAPARDVDGELLSPDRRPMLARANIAGLVPSTLFAGGAVMGGWLVAALLRRRRLDSGEEGLALCALAAGVTVAGYLALLIWQPPLDVKASYVLQAFPFGALLGSAFLSRIRDRSPGLGLAAQALVLAALIANAPMFITRLGMVQNPPRWLWPG